MIRKIVRDTDEYQTGEWYEFDNGVLTYYFNDALEYVAGDQFTGEETEAEELAIVKGFFEFLGTENVDNLLYSGESFDFDVADVVKVVITSNFYKGLNISYDVVN